MAETKIEWTDRTWNPLVGCSIVSPGCTNCYAMKHAARLERIGAAHAASHDGDPGPLGHYAGTTMPSKAGPVWSGQVRPAAPGAFIAPMRWKKPARIFVNSMSDLFHDAVSDGLIDMVFAVMALSPRHSFQVLTKRAGRMHSYMTSATAQQLLTRWAQAHDAGSLYLTQREVEARLLPSASPEHRALYDATSPVWPLPNVWLGVSVEDQKRADERIPLLLRTPAAKRFISAEPLLGPVSLKSSLGGTLWIGGQRGCGGTHFGNGTPDCPRHRHHHHDDRCQPGLDWVIAGGESGRASRPMHPDWPRVLRDQCAAADVPFFFKQWGEWAPFYYRDDGRPGRSHTFPDGQVMHRVGKKAAAAVLDNQLWQHLPPIERRPA